MKPPARKSNPPPTFQFDSDHVLGAQRVSKHREKRQERDKKRKARDDNVDTIPESGAGSSGTQTTAAVDTVEVTDGAVKLDASKQVSKKAKA